MEHIGLPARVGDARCGAGSVRAPEPAARAGTPLGLWRATRVPRFARGARDAAEHGPRRRLLRQRDDGEPLGDAEEGASARPHEEAPTAVFEWIEVWY